MPIKLFWIFALSSAVYFTQGIEGLPGQGLFYYLKETLNYPPEKIMLFNGVIVLAWMAKPFIGYLVDRFLTKKYWIYISLVFDILLVVVLGLMRMPIIFLMILMALNSCNSAFRDVAVDGIMCVEGKKYKATGKIQSVQWISGSIAGLITGIGGAFIAEKWDYRVGFLCLVPVYIIVGLCAHFYNEEKPEKSHSSFLQDARKIFSDKKIIIFGLFIFLYQYTPSFGTPLFFIQRDVFKWNKMWIGTLSTISTVCGIVGSLLYYKFSQRIDIKKWLFFSVFLGALTTLSFLYYTPVTAVIYNALYSFIGMFIFLMVMDFMARHSIRGLEATSFALLCGINNIAVASGSFSGAVLLPHIGLRWLIVLSAFTSFLCLPLIRRIE
jgi:predicted MFS family arabinose efflux permease